MAGNYIEEFTRPFQLNIETSALVVVDMQYASGSRNHGLGKLLQSQGRLEEADYRFGRIDELLIPNIRELIATFRGNSMEVIYLTIGCELPDYSDGPEHLRDFFKSTNNRRGNIEHEIVKELAPRPGEAILNKTTMGAFGSSGIDMLLKAKRLSELVLTGVSTNNCVGMTAMEAADRGYSVVLVSDATGTCSDEMQEVTLKSFKRLWGRVLTTDEVISEVTSGVKDMAHAV